MLCSFFLVRSLDAQTMPASITKAVVVVAEGQVSALNLAQQSRTLHVGDSVFENDTLMTQAQSRLKIRLLDKSVLSIDADSKLVVSQLAFSEETQKKEISLQLIVGRVWAHVTRLFTPDSRFEVHAPNAVAGVRGTRFMVDSSWNEKTQVGCFDGEVTVRGQNGKDAQLNAGTQVAAQNNGLSLVSFLSVTDLKNQLQAVPVLDQILPLPVINQVEKNIDKHIQEEVQITPQGRSSGMIIKQEAQAAQGSASENLRRDSANHQIGNETIIQNQGAHAEDPAIKIKIHVKE